MMLLKTKFDGSAIVFCFISAILIPCKVLLLIKLILCRVVKDAEGLKPFHSRELKTNKKKHKKISTFQPGLKTIPTRRRS